jgi:hypothetical protein
MPPEVEGKKQHGRPRVRSTNSTDLSAKHGRVEVSMTDEMTRLSNTLLKGNQLWSKTLDNSREIFLNCVCNVSNL